MSNKHPGGHAPQRRAAARAKDAAAPTVPAADHHPAAMPLADVAAVAPGAAQMMTAIDHVLAAPSPPIQLEPQGTEPMNDTAPTPSPNTANGATYGNAPEYAATAPTAPNAAESALKQAEGVAADMKAKATQALAGYNDQAKDAMAKGGKVVEDMVAMQKGNMEALAESARIAAKGAQDLARHATEIARKTVEDSNDTMRKLATVKSPTEFMTMQGDAAKAQLDAAVAEMSRFTESYVKLMGDMFQPLQNRYAVAMDKARSTNA